MVDISINALNNPVKTQNSIVFRLVELLLVIV